MSGKLKGFTFVEMAVSLAISGVIIITSLWGYEKMHVFYENLGNNSDRVYNIELLSQLIEKDIDEGKYLVGWYWGFEILNHHGTSFSEYRADGDFLIRNREYVTDTFELTELSIKYRSRLSNIYNGSDLIEALVIDFEEKDEIQQLTFQKTYSPADIINLTVE